MNKKTKDFLSAWKALKSDKNNLLSPDVPLALKDSPAYPLARQVLMSEDQPFERGAVSFKLCDLTLNGLNLAGCKVTQYKGDTHFQLTLKNLCLHGEYNVNVKPDPVIDIDTAGNMLELESQPGKAGADADTGGTLDPQQEAWLDQARDQRTKLSSTPNGQKLMGVYNQHNETYNDVFQNSSAMRTTWKSGGVTKAMAADTSTALNAEDSVINDGSKMYKNADTGEEVTYNSNGFKQQIALCFNTIFQDPGYNPFSPGSLPQGKYLDAAKATLSFAKVVQTTGNDKQKVTPMTQQSVYTSVDGFSGDMPSVSDQEVADLMNQGQGAGGKGTEGDLGWTVLDENDRTMLQALYEANLRERAEKSSITGTVLFTGRCYAELSQVEISAILNKQGELTVDIELPVFDLEINDEKWLGDVGEITRQRLESTYFIRSLLSERLSGKLEQKMRKIIVHIQAQTL